MTDLSQESSYLRANRANDNYANTLKIPATALFRGAVLPTHNFHEHYVLLLFGRLRHGLHPNSKQLLCLLQAVTSIVKSVLK